MTFLLNLFLIKKNNIFEVISLIVLSNLRILLIMKSNRESEWAVLMVSLMFVGGIIVLFAFAFLIIKFKYLSFKKNIFLLILIGVMFFREEGFDRSIDSLNSRRNIIIVSRSISLMYFSILISYTIQSNFLEK